MMDNDRVAVIGAGLAGLVAAGRLQASSRPVTVFEKGRGVGGRLATRRLEDGVCDHGAQFFTARNPAFQALVADWITGGQARIWATGLAGPDAGEDGAAPGYRGAPTMTAIPKALATGLDIRLERQVRAVAPDPAAGWRLTFESGEPCHCAALLITAPVPQALALLDAGAVALDPALRPQLEALHYDRCLAVMALLDGPSALPPPGACRPAPGGPIAWIADNQLKGVSPRPTLTLHAGPDFSAAWWDRREEAMALLLEAARPYLGRAAVRTSQIHGWRYARPRHTWPTPCLRIAETPPLWLAGDAFGGPRVEGAVLSGLAAAAALTPS